MTPNREGFIYPVINQEKCIDCGLCEKVCPTQDSNKEKLLHAEKQDVYAAWNNNIQLRLKSTSGGLFYALASKFIADRGIVYGAVMNNNLTVNHCRVLTLSDLTKLRGSKYVQSDTLDTFVKVKKDLTEGHNVLYSGTPCQIAGLKSFLRSEYPNLYTIDLVCHGTPSPSMFKIHIQYIGNKEKQPVKSFLFRDKKNSGWRAYISYEFFNKKKISVTTKNDFYCHAFYNGWLSRESCYLCEFSQAKRVGDITLSDFWGGEKNYKQLRLQRKHGYNLVICNTPKGQQLFDNISGDISFLKCDISVAKQGDIRLRHAEKRPSLRSFIYHECEKKGYAYVVEKYKYRPSFIKKITPLWIINLIKEIKSRL